jgi:hypothetical protein
MAAATTVQDMLPAPFADMVDKLYRQLGEILTTTTAQKAECSLQCQAGVSTPSLGRSRAGW